MILKILITALACVTLSNSEEVNIWGPGLSPEKITMPARYFFIKVMNSKDRYNPKPATNYCYTFFMTAKNRSNVMFKIK